MRLSRQVRGIVAALVAMAALVLAAQASAQQAQCATIAAARTLAEVDAARDQALQQIESDLVRWRTVATRIPLLNARQGYAAAENRRQTVEVEIAKLQPAWPTDAELRELIKEANEDVAQIDANAQRLQELRSSLQTPSGGIQTPAQADERRATQREIDALAQTVQSADRVEAMRVLRARQAVLQERIAELPRKRSERDTVLNTILPARKRAVDTAKAEFDKSSAEIARLQEMERQIRDCWDKRRKELAPAAAAGPVDGLLDAIEAALVEQERTAIDCAQLQRDVQRHAAEVATLLADSAKLLADVQAAAAAGPAANAGRQAVDVAAAAAQIVAQARSRANQAMQAACAASRVAISDPRNANVATMVGEAQRNRVMAENEVRIAADALNQIRAAAAQVASLPRPAAGATLTALGAQLTPLWRRQQDATDRHKALSDMIVAYDQHDAKTQNEIVRPLEGLRNQPLTRAQSDRVEALKSRAEAVRIRAACSAQLRQQNWQIWQDVIKAGQNVYQALQLVMTQQSATGTPVLAPQEAIENIFKPARESADAIATDAVAAVRCHTDAEKAVAAAPLPPNTGLRCKYKGPSGDYEVVLYDVKTCPPTPGTLSGADRQPKPEILQGFEGRWKADNGGIWTISGGVNSFQVVAHWQGHRGPGHKHDATSSCRRIGDTNTAECQGSGLYTDPEKDIANTYTMKLTLEGNTIKCSFEYTSTTPTERYKGAAEGSAVSKGKGGSCSLTREATK